MSPRAPRGSVLVLALLVMFVTLMAAMTLSNDATFRIDLARKFEDGARAQALASSGLEFGRLRLGIDPAWTGASNVALDQDRGAFTVTAAALTELSRALTAVGTRFEGTDTQTATARPAPHPALAYNSFCPGNLTFEAGATTAGRHRTNGDVGASIPLVFTGTVTTVAGRLVSALILPAQVSFVSSAMAAPAPSEAFFAGRAAALTGVPEPVPGELSLDRVSLTATRNPFGPPHPQGRYSIDCLGKKLRIRRTFLKGMLLVRNCQSLSVEEKVHLEREDLAYPTLLVYGGPMTLNLSSSLSEAEEGGDYNGDGDTDDVFRPEIQGIAWSALGATVRGGGTISGCVIGSTLAIGGSPIFQDDLALRDQRVHGFTASGPWELDPESLGGT